MKSRTNKRHNVRTKAHDAPQKNDGHVAADAPSNAASRSPSSTIGSRCVSAPSSACDDWFEDVQRRQYSRNVRRGMVLESGDATSHPTNSELLEPERSNIAVNFVFPVDDEGEDVRVSHNHSTQRRGVPGGNSIPGHQRSAHAPGPQPGQRALGATGSRQASLTPGGGKAIPRKINKVPTNGHMFTESVELAPLPLRPYLSDDDEEDTNNNNNNNSNSDARRRNNQKKKHNGLLTPRGSFAFPSADHSGRPMLPNEEQDPSLAAALAVSEAAMRNPPPSINEYNTDRPLAKRGALGGDGHDDPSAANAPPPLSSSAMATATAEIMCLRLQEDPDKVPTAETVLEDAVVPLMGTATRPPKGADGVDVYHASYLRCVDFLAQLAATKRQSKSTFGDSGASPNKPAASTSGPHHGEKADGTTKRNIGGAVRRKKQPPPQAESAQPAKTANAGHPLMGGSGSGSAIASEREISVLLHFFDMDKVHNALLQQWHTNHYDPAPTTEHATEAQAGRCAATVMEAEWRELACKVLFGRCRSLRRAAAMARKSFRQLSAEELYTDETTEETRERQLREALLADLDDAFRTDSILDSDLSNGLSQRVAHSPLLTVGPNSFLDPHRGLHVFLWDSYPRAQYVYRTTKALTEVLVLDNSSAGGSIRCPAMSLYEIHGCVVSVHAVPILVQRWQQDVMHCSLGSLRQGDRSGLSAQCAQLLWHVSPPVRMFDVYAPNQRGVALHRGQDGRLYILHADAIHDRSGGDDTAHPSSGGEATGKKPTPSVDNKPTLSGSGGTKGGGGLPDGPRAFSHLKRGALISVGDDSGAEGNSNDTAKLRNVLNLLAGGRRGSISGRGSSETAVVVSTMLYRPHWLAFRPMYDAFQLSCAAKGLWPPRQQDDGDGGVSTHRMLRGNTELQATALLDHITTTLIPSATERLVKEAHASMATVKAHYVYRHSNKDEQIEEAVLDMIRRGALRAAMHEQHLPLAAMVLVLRCCNAGNFGDVAKDGAPQPKKGLSPSKEGATLRTKRKVLEVRDASDDDEHDGGADEGEIADTSADDSPSKGATAIARLQKAVAAKLSEDTTARKIAMRVVKGEMLGRSAKAILRVHLAALGGPASQQLQVQVLNRMRRLVHDVSHAESKAFWDTQLLPLARRKFRLFEGSRDLIFADQRMVPPAAIAACMLQCSPFQDARHSVAAVGSGGALLVDRELAARSAASLPAPLPTGGAPKKGNGNASEACAQQPPECLVQFCLRVPGQETGFFGLFKPASVRLAVPMVAHIPYLLTPLGCSTTLPNPPDTPPPLAPPPSQPSSKGHHPPFAAIPSGATAMDGLVAERMALVRLQRRGSVARQSAWVSAWLLALRCHHYVALDALEALYKDTDLALLAGDIAQLKSDAVDSVELPSGGAGRPATMVLASSAAQYAKLETAESGQVESGPKRRFLANALSNAAVVSTQHSVNPIASRATASEVGPQPCVAPANVAPAEDGLFGVKSCGQAEFARLQRDLLLLLRRYDPNVLRRMVMDYDRLRFGGIEFNANEHSTPFLIASYLVVIKAVASHSIREIGLLDKPKVTAAAGPAKKHTKKPKSSSKQPASPRSPGVTKQVECVALPPTREESQPSATTSVPKGERVVAAVAETPRDEDITQWAQTTFHMLIAEYLPTPADVLDHVELAHAFVAIGDSLESRNVLQVSQLLKLVTDKYSHACRAVSRQDLHKRRGLVLRVLRSVTKQGKLLTSNDVLDAVMALLDESIYRTYPGGTLDFESDVSIQSLLMVVLIGCARVHDAPRTACVRRLLDRLQSDNSRALASLQDHLEARVLGSMYWLFRKKDSLALLSKIKSFMDQKNADANARQRLSSFLDFHNHQLTCTQLAERVGRAFLVRKKLYPSWLDHDAKRRDAAEAARLLAMQEAKIREYEERQRQEAAQRAAAAAVDATRQGIERRRQLADNAEAAAAPRDMFAPLLEMDQLDTTMEHVPLRAQTIFITTQQQAAINAARKAVADELRNGLGSRGGGNINEGDAAAEVFSPRAADGHDMIDSIPEEDDLQLHRDANDTAAFCPEANQTPNTTKLHASTTKKKRTKQGHLPTSRQPLFKAPKPPSESRPSWVSAFPRPVRSAVPIEEASLSRMEDDVSVLLKSIFLFCDVDGDGYVTADEIILACDDMQLGYFVGELRNIFGVKECRYVKHRGARFNFASFQSIVMDGCGLA